METGECCRAVETGVGREGGSVPEPSRGEVRWGTAGSACAALQPPSASARAGFSLVGLAMWDLFKLGGKAVCLSAAADHLRHGLYSQPKLICSGT